MAASPALADGTEAETTWAGTDRDAIDAAASILDDDLIALRRDLHADTEGPGQEVRTSATVAELLTEAGLAVTTGVGAPGADLATSCPHFGAFDPDERSIGVGVRAMALWLAARTRHTD